jgi:hypothetical protein
MADGESADAALKITHQDMMGAPIFSGFVEACGPCATVRLKFIEMLCLELQ